MTIQETVEQRKSVLICGADEPLLRDLLKLFSESSHVVTIAPEAAQWCELDKGLRFNDKMTVMDCLRVALRQDPDVVVVSSADEIPRDMVRATILTGHQCIWCWTAGDVKQAESWAADLGFALLVSAVDGSALVLEEKFPVVPASPANPSPQEPEFTEEEVAQVKEALWPLRRRAFVPSAQDEPSDSFLIPTTPEPDELQLILQLAVREMPMLKECFPEGRSYLQLWVPPEVDKFLLKFSEESAQASHPEMVYLGGWEELYTVPHYEDELLELDEETREIRPDLGDNYPELSPLSLDYLGGWPYWTQSCERGTCPHCGKKLQLLFQISNDWEALIPSSFAADGTGQIMQCPEHLEQLTWVWAC